MKKYKHLYLFSAIPIAIIFIYRYLPVLGALIAFKDYRISLGFAGIFTSPNAEQYGFHNFIRLFTSMVFYRVLSNTVIISAYKLIITFPLPIILALMLNEIRNMHFKKVVQTISYLPYFLSATIIYGIILSLLSPVNGLINNLAVVLGGQPTYYLADPKWFRTIVVLWDVWQLTGWNSIIYLAAIASINPELYESAVSDGASTMQQIWHITLPGIIPIIVIMLVFRIGGLLDAGFEQIFLMYSPPVYSVADIINTYMLCGF